MKNKRLESSGGSSGIGSDHPPSPESPEAPESRFHTMETHSTSGKLCHWQFINFFVLLKQSHLFDRMTQDCINQEFFRKLEIEDLLNNS